MSDGHAFEPVDPPETAKTSNAVWFIRSRCKRCGLTEGDIAPDPPENELVTCPECGMSWTTRISCGRCMFRSGGVDPDCPECHGRMDMGLRPDVHECPEPYPYKVALSMVQMAESMALGGSPMIVSQREKARIKLGLAQGPDE